MMKEWGLCYSVGYVDVVGAGAGSDRGAGVGLLEQSLKVEQFSKEARRGRESQRRKRRAHLGEGKMWLHWKAHQQKFGFGCFEQLDQESLE